MDYVYIVDRHCKPLMPTKRFKHVRELLKSGKAVPICNNPFTIKLKYDVPGFTQPIHEGIDPGRENIGDACSLENGENVYLSNIRTNNKNIKLRMADRAGFRCERRRHDRQSKQRKARHDGTEIQNGDDDVVRSKHACKSRKVSYPGADNQVTHKVIQGKEGKFNNRKRHAGWLTPSARQLIQLTMREIGQTARILPVSHICLERCAFDFQKLENEDITDWNHGPLYGFKTYKDYIGQEQHGICLLCGKRHITQYHHINPQKDGKFDHVSNIVGLCDDCHKLVHNSQEAWNKLKTLKEAARKKYQVGLLNSVIPALIDALRNYCSKKEIVFTITDGKETAITRRLFNLPKDHCIDAYAISLADRDIDEISLCDEVHLKRRFKKKSKNIIGARNQRIYRLDGKVVAKNRHKATDQKDDSLEEFLAKFPEQERRKLIHRLEILRARRTYTYRKTGQVPPAHPGDLIRYEKRNKTDGHVKAEVFPAVSVEYAEIVRKDKSRTWTKREWKIGIDENRMHKAKFCLVLQSGCLQAIGVEKTKVWLDKLEKELEKRQPSAA